MSSFIVPLTGLPSLSSLGTAGGAARGSAAQNMPFANILEEAVQNLSGAAENSQQSMYNLAVGGSDDLHSGAIDMLKSGTAVSFTSGMVSSVIRAYNELMRMSV